MFQLTEYLKTIPQGDTIFGECYGRCREFIDYVYGKRDNIHEVNLLDTNSINILIHGHKCKLTIVDGVCLFYDMENFQTHAKLMCDKMKHSLEMKQSVQCFAVDGTEFRYHDKNVYVMGESKACVGFLHWVILVQREKETYIIDPTIYQFHTTPNSILVNLSCHKKDLHQHNQMH